jgi:ketosteroid isomerase-like protein
MEREHLDMVRDAVWAFGTGDIERLGAYYTADASITVVPEGWPEPAPVDGRDAVMRQFRRLLEDWQEHSLRICREAVGDNWAVMEFLWSTRGASSGVALDMTVAGAYRVEGGRIAEARFFWTWDEALSSAGLRDQRH